MAMIVIYKVSDGSVLSYISYNERKYDENGNDIGLLKPSLKKAADNHGLTKADLNVKEFTKENPQQEDFKDNINDIAPTDLADIE